MYDVQAQSFRPQSFRPTFSGPELLAILCQGLNCLPFRPTFRAIQAQTINFLYECSVYDSDNFASIDVQKTLDGKINKTDVSFLLISNHMTLEIRTELCFSK